MIDIGPPRDDAEIDRYAEVLTEALGFPAREPRDYMERYEIADLRLVRLAGEVVGGAALIRFGHFFGGARVPAVGINAVGITAHARGKGVATALMESIVRELRAEGTPLSSLYPATQPLYRAVGYEQAGALTRYAVPLVGVAAGDRGLELAPIDLGATHDVAPLYTEVARAGAGLLDRNRWLWQRILDPMFVDESWALRVGPADAPEGYVAYQRRRLPGVHRFALVCRDFVATTPRAARRLWSLLADHRSMVDHVLVFGPPSGVSLLGLREQPATIEWLMRWMVRVCDVRGALEARGYAPGLTTSFAVEVVDALLPDNAGVYAVEIAGGRAAVERAAEVGSAPAAAPRIDVRGLAALYTGNATTAEVARAGLLDGGSDEGRAAIDAAFAGPAPWMAEMF